MYNNDLAIWLITITTPMHLYLKQRGNHQINCTLSMLMYFNRIIKRLPLRE